MSPTADLTAIAEAGKQTRATYQASFGDPDTAGSAAPYLATQPGIHLGIGGKFDWQRQGNRITGFRHFPQFRDVSNVNIGLFAQPAGLTQEETLTTASRFASMFSSNARRGQPYGLDPETAEFIREGYRIGASGLFDTPRSR
jgi:hypothetical protein